MDVSVTSLAQVFHAPRWRARVARAPISRNPSVLDLHLERAHRFAGSRPGL